MSPTLRIVLSRNTKGQLNTPISNFYTLFEGQLIQMTTQCLWKSGYFRKAHAKGHKIQVINFQANSWAIRQILMFLIGKQCKFQCNRQILCLLEAAMSLQCSSLQKLLIEKIECYIEEMNIFEVLDFAQKMKHSELIKICYAELIDEDFKQLKINHQQFLNCEKQTVKNMLRFHHKAKQSGKTKGLNFGSIRQIINAYNQHNNTGIDIFTVMTLKSSQIIAELPEQDLQYIDVPCIDSFNILTLISKSEQKIMLNSESIQLQQQKSVYFDCKIGEKSIDLSTTSNLTQQQFMEKTVKNYLQNNQIQIQNKQKKAIQLFQKYVQSLRLDQNVIQSKLSQSQNL